MNNRLPVAIYSQRDPRWKDKRLGFSTLTLGGYGCVVTCLAMLCTYFGFEVVPDELNKKLKEVDGFFDKSLMLWHKLTNVFPEIIFDDLKDYPTRFVPQTQIDKINSYLKAGKPVIAWVDHNPDQAIQQHFVLIIGKEGNDYWINDPWTGDQALLSKRYGKTGYQEPKYAIMGLRYYSGPVPKPGEELPVWMKNLKPFFEELGLKEEEVEPKVRSWKGMASTLMGHVEKWVGALDIKLEEGDSNITEENVDKYLAKVDQEVSGLIDKEDMLTALWGSTEGAIGRKIDMTAQNAQKSMTEALVAVEGHIGRIEKENQDLKDELERVQSKRILDRFTASELLAEVVAKTMERIFSILPNNWKGGEK